MTATPWFYEVFFFKTKIIRQLRKWNESKKKCIQKPLWFCMIFPCGCKCGCLCVCAYACKGYSCVLICVCMRLSQFANAVGCISRSEFVGVS